VYSATSTSTHFSGNLNGDLVKIKSELVVILTVGPVGPNLGPTLASLDTGPLHSALLIGFAYRFYSQEHVRTTFYVRKDDRQRQEIKQVPLVTMALFT
jgi:hypothetical protein